MIACYQIINGIPEKEPIEESNGPEPAFAHKYHRVSKGMPDLR
jgi:hypothetical protein